MQPIKEQHWNISRNRFEGKFSNGTIQVAALELQKEQHCIRSTIIIGSHQTVPVETSHGMVLDTFKE